MDHGRWPFPWSNFHGPISLKYQLTKPLGPSLGVNQMWTKNNDHAPKGECGFSYKYMPQKASFEGGN